MLYKPGRFRLADNLENWNVVRQEETPDGTDS